MTRINARVAVIKIQQIVPNIIPAGIIVRYIFQFHKNVQFFMYIKYSYNCIKYLYSLTETRCMFYFILVCNFLMYN